MRLSLADDVLTYYIVSGIAISNRRNELISTIHEGEHIFSLIFSHNLDDEKRKINCMMTDPSQKIILIIDALDRLHNDEELEVSCLMHLKRIKKGFVSINLSLSTYSKTPILSESRRLKK